MIRASIFLHAKAPDGGGSGPSGGFRPLGTQPEAVGISRSRSRKEAAVSGNFGSRDVGGGRLSGRTKQASWSSDQRASVPRTLSGVGGAGTRTQNLGAGGFFGDDLSGAGGRVALQFLTAGLEGVGQTLYRHLPATAAPLPRVGGLASPGRRSLSRGSARLPGSRDFACGDFAAGEAASSEAVSREPGSGGVPCAAA